MDIGSKIRQYRIAEGMSQEALAERLFITRQTLSNWENGKTVPDIQSLLLLSDAFRISLDALVYEDPCRFNPVSPKDIRQFRLGRRVMWIILLIFFGTLPIVACLPQLVGILLWSGMYLVAMGCILRVEWLRRRFDIQTRRETTAFLSGQRLGRLESAVEQGKRPYQKSLRCVSGLLLLEAVTAILVPPILKLLGM